MKKRKWILISMLGLVVIVGAFWKISGRNINHDGLLFLGWVKSVMGDAPDLSSFEKEEKPIISHEAWSDLLSGHVNESGRVNYQGFVEHQADLTAYLDLLSHNPPGKNWSKDEKLAYWMNAYNAFTVKLIIDHYPIGSIKEIADGLPMINSPWDLKFFEISGIPFDLNTIEHEILRKQFNEPRIHFAINCASASCPNLRNEAFQSVILEEQLESQTRDFINDPEKNRISESGTELSKMFSWFENDFGGETEMLNFIERYNSNINKSLEPEYKDYDWNLNE